MTDLWSPVTLGRMSLQHRLVMAPMTRSRAQADGTPGRSAATYYAQRASMGLLITEGTQPSADGQGYLNTPGLHTDRQVAGWREVADAVHAAGGHLVVQLMHVGRKSHPDNTPHGRQALAPSAIAAGEQMFTAVGMQELPVPRAMTVEEIRRTVDDFAAAARRAVDAGADAVEIHGANGYLLHQFLAPNANVRTDGYGGSVPGRIRMVVETVAAVAGAIGPDRTALRISPGALSFHFPEGDGLADTYLQLLAGLDPLGILYLHVMHVGDEELLRQIRRAWRSTLMVNRPGRAVEDIPRDLVDGLADLVAVGAPALANPDLPRRLRTGAALNEPDQATFYGGDDRGYLDYPTLDGSAGGPGADTLPTALVGADGRS